MKNTIEIKSPFDGHLIKELPLMDETDIENLLSKANALFKDRNKWLEKHERIAILEKTAQIMSTRIDELTKIAAEEGGKPYKDSKIEVIRAINGVKLAAENIGHIKGEEIPMGLTKASENRMAFTFREPIGVVVSVSAFNHPLNLAVHQTAPAIAVGAPVIIKPASTTPLSALNFAEILYEAGLPKDWCRVAVCKSNIAEKLVTDKRVNFFSFIGSAKIGWYLQSKLSPGTRSALEHGGVAPVIVEKDANLSKTLPMLLKGGYYHAGQVCVSVQKIFVQEDIAEKFTIKYTELVKKLKVGDPLDEKTDVGPIIDSFEIERIESWVKEAKKTGAEIRCGGKRLTNSTYEPTVIFNPDDEINISKDEVFGPVVCIYPYKNINEAIEKANSLDVAFQAAIYTENINVAMEAVNKINASAVMINDHTAFRVDWMPFGGRDVSGIGIGGIPYSMHEMTRDKLMVINRNI